MGFGGFGTVFMIIWLILFFGIAGVIGYSIVGSILKKIKNDNSPRISVPAKVVTKRMQVGHHHGGTGSHVHTYTVYFVCFEVESGDRMELSVDGSEYGMIVEGDCGVLTFQGTRFLSFERKKDVQGCGLNQ